MRIRDAYNSNSTWVDHEYNPNSPTSFDDLPGFQGRTQDRENGGIDFRNRFLRLPPFGRFGQPDPNGTGLVVSNALRYHVQPPTVAPDINPHKQYSDGPNIYELLGSNPNSRSDPTGLFFNEPNAGDNLLITRDWDDIYDSITGDGTAYLGVQGAATFAGFWGDNLAALPRFAGHASNLSQGFSDFADYYAEQIIYLPVEGMFAGGSVASAGKFIAAGSTAVTGVRFAKATKHAYELHHLLPRAPKLARFFQRVGLNIEDFVIKIPLAKHRLKPSGIHTGSGTNWNAVWGRWILDNPNARKIDVLRQLKKMVKDFGLDSYVSIILRP